MSLPPEDESRLGPDGATRVRCEESMAGLMLGLFYNDAKLRADLMKWLTALKAGAEQRLAEGSHFS